MQATQQAWANSAIAQQQAMQHQRQQAMQWQQQQQQQQQPQPPAAAAAAAAASSSSSTALQSVSPASAEMDVSYTPASHGYAMIISEKLRYVLRSKHLQLGREMSEKRGNGGVVGISAAKNISRVHATIGWETAPIMRTGEPPEEDGWVCTCLGKNGMHHEGEFKAMQTRFRVRHKDKMQIGETTFFFVEPKPMSTSQIRHF